MHMNLAEAERLLTVSPNYRLLRRIPRPSSWVDGSAAEETRRAVFLDTETTGLDLDHDEVIELALLPFEYEHATGRIVRVDEARAFSGLRQPSFSIPAEVSRIHGITDADVAGRAVDPDRVREIVEYAHLVIAHNAAFDRPMVEKHWPIFETKHWACSLVDIDWRSEGLGTAKLDYLLMRQGWFHSEHRAMSDAEAGLFLLSLPLPVSQRLAMAALLDTARRPLRAVRAEDTPYALRTALKQRGYQWDAGTDQRPKAWWILTNVPDEEVAWLNAEIYPEPRSIPVVSVPPTRRYSSRVWG
jgi:DNA polymerase III subunit epsilon